MVLILTGSLVKSHDGQIKAKIEANINELCVWD